MKKLSIISLLISSLALGSGGSFISGGGGGGGGIASINGDTTAAQVITAGPGITVGSSGGTTTIGSTAIQRSIFVVSSNTVAASTARTDFVYLVSGTTTITIPTAVSNTNRYTVKNTGTNTVTVNFTGGQTGDGSVTLPLTPNTSVDLISDNNNWRII